jgi:DNA-binding PadR family transcriptional regulator
MMTMDETLRFLESRNGHINHTLTEVSLYAGDAPGNPRVSEGAVPYDVFEAMKHDGLIASSDQGMPPKNNYRITEKGRARIQG